MNKEKNRENLSHKNFPKPLPKISQGFTTSDMAPGPFPKHYITSLLSLHNLPNMY